MPIENGTRLSELPEGDVTPARVYGIGDNRSLQFTPRQVVDAGRPMASNAEAVAGSAIDVAMNPANTQVAIDARVTSQFAPLIEDAQNAADAATEAAAEATAAAAGVAALYTVADYATAVLVAPTLPAEVLVISADVGGTETRWIRDVTGTALGGGWAPAGIATPQHYGAADAAGLAAAVAASGGFTVRLDYDPATLPTDYRDVVMEHVTKSRNRNYAQTAFSGNLSQTILRAASGAHAGRTESARHTEMLAWGSTQNGPANATVAESMYITKRGYAGGAAVGGEIDALEIFLRQDGPDGFPSQDPGSSDAAALIINAQNVGTCGFVAVMDASVSNIARTSGFPLDVSMQVQSGVIDANNAAGKVSFGHVAVMRAGTGRTAFHAGVSSTGTWENLTDSPNYRVTWAGQVRLRDAAYTDFGAQISRGAGTTGNLAIENRGTGGITIRSIDNGSITFAPNNTNRWQFAGSGAFQPAVDLAVELGNAARRIANTHTNALVVYGNTLNLPNLPVYADNAAALAGGLTAGRVYRTAAGDLKVVI